MNSPPSKMEGFEVTWKIKGKVLRVVRNRDTLNDVLSDLALQGIVPLKIKRVKLHFVRINDECVLESGSP